MGQIRASIVRIRSNIVVNKGVVGRSYWIYGEKIVLEIATFEGYTSLFKMTRFLAN